MRRRTAGAQARGTGAGGPAGAQADVQGTLAQALGAQASALADTRGPARRAAGARGLGVLLGCGLCTWCTQPVFDPV